MYVHTYVRIVVLYVVLKLYILCSNYAPSVVKMKSFYAHLKQLMRYMQCIRMTLYDVTYMHVYLLYHWCPFSPMQDSTHLIINIMDLNDNFPMFTQPSYSATIVETEMSNTVAMLVSAHLRELQHSLLAFYYL